MIPVIQNRCRRTKFCYFARIGVFLQDYLRRAITIVGDGGDKFSTWQTFSGDAGLRTIYRIYRYARNGKTVGKT
ncbi:hypothetical protein DPMN_028225 [Dreissena polymorpha]|uniref:Uncharacterized protein n=1 Tax=Dreissena polymorpha TaxID=45954 RepID=A0A9D4RE66_DREPO|nr:hypothetical protein DPMN_028225 [Dreissena polymorpha]